MINTDKADVLLKASKEQVKVLARKCRPNCEDLNRTICKELKVIAFQNYITHTREGVGVMRDSKKLTTSGLFLDDQRMVILESWPNSEDSDNDKHPDEEDTQMKDALC